MRLLWRGFGVVRLARYVDLHALVECKKKDTHGHDVTVTDSAAHVCGLGVIFNSQNNSQNNSRILVIVLVWQFY